MQVQAFSSYSEILRQATGEGVEFTGTAIDKSGLVIKSGQSMFHITEVSGGIVVRSMTGLVCIYAVDSNSFRVADWLQI